jgi:2-polyprenyl-3-methyl-5-hydroxy-6-metoxy-1,4-benzoquinol methylase
VANPDKSNGYEEIAPTFISGRGRNHLGIGATIVAQWSQKLAEGAQVLDLGCGTGVPISQVLIERGFHVYGVDASPTMIAAFQARFPSVPVECCGVEDSNFFGKTFDGVVAWRLFFLFDVEGQSNLIRTIAGVLRSGGRLLFTTPSQSCSSLDGMTGRQSLSLGFNAYQKMLQDEGLSLVETRSDEGENHYYLAQKF